ncbi:MAG: tetratricopeptide repeat protein [Gemmataceae bacterium]|nr:tetratricopeptide repeat protein [Gemmataceae bacterium]
MMLRSFGLLFGVLLALVVPLGALMAAADPERQVLGLIAAPFAWTRLLVVHLLATLPLSLLVALGFRGRTGMWPAAGVGVVLGVVLTVATIRTGTSLGTWVDEQQAGYFARLAIRVIWCLALQVPWLLCGLAVVVPRTERYGDLPRWAAASLALLVALAGPAVYTAGGGGSPYSGASNLLDAQSRKAEELLARARLARAHALVEGLCDLGSTQPLAGELPDAVRGELRQALQAATEAARAPLPARVSSAARVERAQLLAVLDRLDEAERLLQPLAADEPAATLLLAAIWQDQQRWEESSRGYRHALVLLGRDPATVPARVQAYDGLAFNARARQAYREAETIYAEALEQVPQARAHFHFELGRHHHTGGRPGQALHHLETAARLDPTAYGSRASALIQNLTLYTPGCLLRGQSP